ncbi:MAG: hypothetical protein GY810_25695 [Aureispira sp.]|nr:hypothetical protein [Aureispira sp.]
MAVINEYLKKMTFWQRLSSIVVVGLGVFLFAVFTWTIIENSNQTTWDGRPASIDTFLLVVWGVFFIFSALCIFLGVMLWKSASALNRYKLHTVVTDLEQAFKYQRYFWIGGTVIITCILLFVLIALFGV